MSAPRAVSALRRFPRSFPAYLARALAELGVFDEAVLTDEEAIRMAEALDDPLSLVLACSVARVLSTRQGGTEPGARLLERESLCAATWISTQYVHP